MSDDYSIANLIWDDLRSSIKKTNELMIFFLQSVCGVQEFHPMIDTFDNTDTPKSLCDCLDRVTKESDQIFKKEQGTSREDVGEVNIAESDIALDVIDVDIDDSAADSSFLGDNGLADRIQREILEENQKNNSNDSETAIGVDVPAIGVDDENQLIDDEDTNPFTSFLSVIMTDMDKLLEDPSIIVKSMGEMKLKKREKGSITNEQKYKSLTGRWFGCKEEKIESK